MVYRSFRALLPFAGHRNLSTGGRTYSVPTTTIKTTAHALPFTIDRGGVLGGKDQASRARQRWQAIDAK